MYKELIEQIEKHNNICIYRHKLPDGDALGSQNGLAELIKVNYPHKKVFVYGEMREGLFELFPNPVEEDRTIVANSLVIICDTANVDRIDGLH